MLTLKLLRENPEFVIAKLARKNFDAKEIVEKINGLDQNRRALQLELDTCLAEQKKKAAEIGGLMKQGKKEEAEAVKTEVAALKARSAEIERKSEENNTELNSLLVLLPNIPCDQVPEGKTAEDNVVVCRRIDMHRQTVLGCRQICYVKSAADEGSGNIAELLSVKPDVCLVVDAIEEKLKALLRKHFLRQVE